MRERAAASLLEPSQSICELLCLLFGEPRAEQLAMPVPCMPQVILHHGGKQGFHLYYFA